MANKRAARPGRRPRTETIVPNPRKSKPVSVGDGGFSLSLAEMVRVMRLRAGFTSHQALSNAARAYLPEWVAMNRRLIQQIEKGERHAAEVNDVELLAIAAACKQDPVAAFGIVPGDSPDIDPLLALFRWAFRDTQPAAGATAVGGRAREGR